MLNLLIIMMLLFMPTIAYAGALAIPPNFFLMTGSSVVISFIIELSIFFYLLLNKISWQRIGIMVITMNIAACVGSILMTFLVWLIMSLIMAYFIPDFELSWLAVNFVQLGSVIIVKVVVAGWHLKETRIYYNPWVILGVILAVNVFDFILLYFIAHGYIFLFI